MNIQTDKIIHFTVCALMAHVAAMLCISAGMAYHLASLVGAGFAMTAGFGKELYDKADYGLFDWHDILADLLGAVFGVTVAIGTAWITDVII